MTSESTGIARMAPCRVLIVDDHPVVRQGLGQLVANSTGMMLCGEADCPSAALDAIERYSPDVVVADLSYQGLDGIELIKDVKVRYPQLPLLILSVHDESFYAQRVLKAGAMGYLMKHEATTRVIDGIRAVRRGRVFLSDRMAQLLLSQVAGGGTTLHAQGAESLTDRELEVIRLIGEGRSTRQVAEQLCLSIKTIETHRENIKQKLQLDNATQLMQYAVRFAVESS